MGAEKLLYIADPMQDRPAHVSQFAGLRTLGLEEIIFLGLSYGETWEAELAHHGLHARTLTVAGPLVPGILDTARREGVALISTSVDAESGPWFRRSFAENLIRSSPVPVILLPGGGRTWGGEPAAVFDHVILATDWSEPCKRAMHYLLNFETVIKELEIVHVVDKKLSVKEMRELRYKLSAWRSAFLDHGIDAESHIYAGQRHEEILLARKDYDGTCVVMGTSGKLVLRGMFSRGCCYRVAAASQVPTMVLH